MEIVYGGQATMVPQGASADGLTDCCRDEIHFTAQYSAPSPGGVTRLAADENDKKVKDWFRDQVLALGAEYQVGRIICLGGSWGDYWPVTSYLLCICRQVNATGSQFAKFPGMDDSIPPIAMGSHLDTVATGGRFDGPLGVCRILAIPKLQVRPGS